MKNLTLKKGDTVFYNPFGAVSVNSLKTKKHMVLIVDGEDVYGKLEAGKVTPIRESDKRVSLKIAFTTDKDGNETPAQEGTVLAVSL